MKRLPKAIIDKPALLNMVLSAIEVYDKETYGILIGTRKKKDYVVKYAVPYQTTTRKKREVSVCTKRDALVVRNIKGVSGHNYVGEFHSHTNNYKGLTWYDKQSLEEYGEGLSMLVVVNPTEKACKWEYNIKDKSLCGSVDDEFYVLVKAYIYDHIKKKVTKIPIKCTYIQSLNRIKMPKRKRKRVVKKRRQKKRKSKKAKKSRKK